MTTKREDNSTKSFPIQVVSRRTGLSPELLRTWEKRYGVVAPHRTPSGQRRYSDRELSKLHLLQRAVSAGHRIGELVELSPEDLQGLVLEESEVADNGRNGNSNHERLLESCMNAVKDLDGTALQSILNRSLVSLDGSAYVEDLLVPLFNRIGDEWERGLMEPCHEHLATSTVRNILARFLSQIPEDLEHRILVATPSGHHHEIGALLVGVSAVLVGYRVLYFGTNLPASDIVSAAKKTNASIVALSVVFPANDSRTLGELKTVARGIPPGVRLVVGGKSSGHYSAALKNLGALIVSDLAEFQGILESGPRST